MLIGYPPFYGCNDDDTFEKIMFGEYNKESQEWNNISSEAKDLI